MTTKNNCLKQKNKKPITMHCEIYNKYISMLATIAQGPGEMELYSKYTVVRFQHEVKVNWNKDIHNTP